MASALLQLSDIHLTFGGTPLLSGASLLVHARDRIALVGRNGSGKSTLMKIACGMLAYDKGERFLNRGTTVGYLPQEPDLSAYTRVADYVESALTSVSDNSAPARFMEALKLDPDAHPDHLSGGEARRAALAHLLSTAPDIALLDEPTNHLDLPAIEWLEDWLRSQSQMAAIIISHDRQFLENITTQTVWVDRGITRRLDRGFAHFESWRDKLLEEEQAEQHKLDRKIAAEEDWLRYGVTARRKRNVRRLGELHSLRQQRKDYRGPQGSVQISAAKSKNVGKRIITTENISKSFDDRKVVDDFSIEITRGDRIGLVGPNGAGKTTLLKLLTGQEPPDHGKLQLADTIEMITLDQRRANLSPDSTVADAITDGRGDFVTIGTQKKHVTTYLQEFLFSNEQWRMPVSALSGGERGRLALAAAMAKPCNLLILDEPTNDLDLETLELLEEMLTQFDGTLLLVSHDRRFLDHLVTSIIAPVPAEGPGKWREFIGGYDDLRRQLGHTTNGKKAQKETSKTGEKSPQPPAKPRSAKLSYKEQYALDHLPAKIETLENNIATIRQQLDDPALFQKNPDEFAALAKKLEELECTLTDAEEEWLRLEEKRENLS